MTKERELLRQVQVFLDKGDLTGEALRLSIAVDEYLSTPSDGADEPVKCKRCNGTGVIKTGEIDCYPDGTPYMNGPVVCVEDCPNCHPPKPAEPEAHELQDDAFNLLIALQEAWPYVHDGCTIKSKKERITHLLRKHGDFADLYQPKPAEPEADLFCDNNCTWLDHHQNCINAEPAARKPMTREEIIQGVTVDTSDDFHAGYWAGIRFAEKHHGILEEP